MGPRFGEFVPALAYHFCLNLPASFTQPGARLLVEPCIVKKSNLYTIKLTSQQRMEMVSHLLILLFLLFMPFLPRTVHHFSGNGRERELHWRDHTRDGAQMTWQAELPEYIYHWHRCHSCMWNVGQELGIADARRTGWPSSFFLSTACFNFK